MVDNPKKIKFREIEAAQLPRALDDDALAVINSNYALGAGLNPVKDALAIESKDSPYANIVASARVTTAAPRSRSSRPL